MLTNILYGLPMMAVCLMLQTLLLVVVQHYYARHQHHVRNASWWPTLWVVWSVMVMLFMGTIAQIGIWALLFQLLEEFPDYESAFYHSAVNFSTLGYGDIVMSAKHQLLGPIQAINGVLMIGVSTAILMAAFQDAMRKTLDSRHK